MKTLVGVLGGLGIACLLVGAALWIQGWTIVRGNQEICRILQQQHDGIAADLDRGLSPKVEDVLPLAITGLRVDTQDRGSAFDAYCKATWGVALMFSAVAVIAWRRQKLPGIERQIAGTGAPIRREVSERPTTKEETSAALGIGKKQTMSSG